MKTELRLGSVVGHGVGGPETGGINLIYIFLLHEFGQDLYSRIGINQIGEDLNEFVMKEPGNKIHVNIRYPVYQDFESKSADEKNKIRLDIIHTALLRIAEYDKKLDTHQLEVIRKEILDNNFSFEFVCKSHINKKEGNLVAKILVRPEMTKFDFYVLIEEEGKTKCRLWIYSGGTDLIYFSDLFSQGKWKSDNELIVTGKRKEVEIRVLINECKAEFKNLTQYAKPPYFEMMRADISAEDKEKAYQDWKHSLPPAVASVIRQAHN